MTVTNANDANAGSLRAAIAAATAPDTRIQFASPALNGATITLTSHQLFVNGKNVEFDASTLSSGLTISGNNARRVLLVDSGTLSLTGSQSLEAMTDLGEPDSGFRAAAAHSRWIARCGIISRVAEAARSLPLLPSSISIGAPFPETLRAMAARFGSRDFATQSLELAPSLETRVREATVPEARDALMARST